jgi:Domain of unknown function (DUF4304)
MTPEITPQKRAAAIIKKWLTPTLQARGFTKKGIVYTRVLTDVVHLIDIQQSPYNKKTGVSFALNLGVHVPGIRATAYRAPEHADLSGASGVIGTRPGLITEPKLSQWWDVKSSEDPAKDDDIGRSLLAIVEDGAFRRFFDRFMDKKGIAEFLMAPREKRDKQIDPMVDSVCFVYAGLIWDQLGDYDKCRECMAKAVEAAKGKRLEADMEEFARKYVCGSVDWNRFPMPRG